MSKVPILPHSAIQPRHPSFELDEALAGDWHGGDAFRTAFFNALSLTFPIGERFFIDCVRAFEDDIADGQLQADARGFIGQEAVHGRKHQEYNERLCELRGYDLARLESRQRKRVEWAKRNVSRYQRLAATVAFEHITAIIADGILRNPVWLAGVPPQMAALWRWHAVEETEHKAVTFDVYRTVGGYERSRRTMLRLSTMTLLTDVMRCVYLMLKADGKHRDLALWWRGLRFLFGRSGVLRSVFPHWRAFKRPDFHPWDNDNRQLIVDWHDRSVSPV